MKKLFQPFLNIPARRKRTADGAALLCSTEKAAASGSGMAVCTGVLAAALYALMPEGAVAGVSTTGDVSPNPGPAETWDLGGQDLLIGNNSSGSLLISGGGVVSNANGLIGSNPSGSGSVIVMGAGSQWINTNGLYVGGRGDDTIDPGANGSLIIADGGVVTSSTGYVGHHADGSATVRGAGAQWRTEKLNVSVDASRSILRIVDGGGVFNDSAIVGVSSGSDGTATVSGTGALWDARYFDIGYLGGKGTLNILDGGQVKNIQSAVGNSGTGTALLKDAGSNWAAGELSVGNNGGAGQVTIADGAKLSAVSLMLAGTDTSTGTLNIGAPNGQEAAAAGTLLTAAITFGPGDARLVFNHTDDAYIFDVAVHGTGTIDHIAGVTTLSSGGNFMGETNVAGGVLLIGKQLFGQQNTAMPLASRLNIQAGGVAGMSSDSADVLMHINNAGQFYVGNPLAAGAVTPVSFSVSGDFSNSGTVHLNDGGMVAGNALRIAGNYAGHGGAIHFNTALDGDDSVTDSLSIDGDTSGTTYVVVNNAGGSGASTLNGIELIRVGGASDGDFIQDGRIVSGAYEYRLTRGQEDNAGNWYLDNSVASFEPGPDPDPDPGILPDPTPGIDTGAEREPDPGVDGPGDGGTSGGSKRSGVAVERPESGSYTANLAAANSLFMTSLHERPGQTHYVDALTGEHKRSSVWMRHAGSWHSFSDRAGQLQTRDNRYMVQIGGHFAQGSSDGQDRWLTGAMIGYGTSHSKTTSQITGYHATGKLSGYGLGVYGTWFADAQSRTGAYVDTWAHYGWFDNMVAGEGLEAEKYRSRGSTLSVESGYTVPVTQQVFVQPKLQVVRMGVRADNHREVNGTRIAGSGNGNIQTRLGMHVFMQPHADRDKSGDNAIRPFVETNWIRNTKTFGTTMNDVTLTQAGATNIAELKLGVGGNLSRNLHLWGRLGLQKGSNDYSDASITGGIRYQF